MTEEKKPEVRRRRLRGQKLGELRRMMKKLHGAVKALNRCRDDILDAHELFPDQINWGSGILYDVGAKNADGKTEEERAANRIAIGRITKEEQQRERQLRLEVESIDSEIGDLKWELAEKLGCFPADIDSGTGQITGTPVDGVDPDAPQEEPEETPEEPTGGKRAIPISAAQ